MQSSIHHDIVCYAWLHTDAETSTSDTVSDGCNPGELRLVDGEVRARRAHETLFVQDAL